MRVSIVGVPYQMSQSPLFGLFYLDHCRPSLELVIADFAPSVHKAPAKDVTILLMDS
jgi:hypothetical protein